MALMAALLASIASGIVGSYVVVKRIVFISGSIAHAVLGGMGIFLYLRRNLGLDFLSPMMGAFLFAILGAGLIGYTHMKHRQREDSVIAALWALGMAIGVIFISMTPGYNVEMMNFLFGNILWSTPKDLLLLGLLDSAIILAVFLFHQKFQLICFDEKQAQLQGLPITRLYFYLLAMVAVTIVLLIQIVGSILVVSMLCIPAAIANSFTKKLSSMIFLAIVISMTLSSFGAIFSLWFNLPLGATIALCSTTCYLFTSSIRRLKV
jgi:zinc transport system permease protein